MSQMFETRQKTSLFECKFIIINLNDSSNKKFEWLQEKEE